MRKLNITTLLTLLGLLVLSSCNNDHEGDDYTPAKRISLAEVSIMVPETYTSEGGDANNIEYTNDFGGGSVEIRRENLNGRTEEAVFAAKQSTYTYFTKTSNTMLSEHNTLVVEEDLGNIHRMIHYVFIHNGSVYTLDFSWTIEKEVNSRQAMNAMLGTLVIG